MLKAGSSSIPYCREEIKAVPLHTSFQVKSNARPPRTMSNSNLKRSMRNYIFAEPSTYHEAVERNAILLDDSYFVRPTTGGEVVFQRDNSPLTVDKSNLTRNAARRLVKYLYEGHHTFENLEVDSSAALMLYVRNGYQKQSFWKALLQEMTAALEELLDGKKPFSVDNFFFHSPYPEYLKTAFIPELADKAKDYAERYDDKAYLIYVDSEIERVLREAESEGQRFYAYEVDEAVGQYVFVDETMGLYFLDREMLLNTKCRDLMMYSVGNCVEYAASSFFEYVFNDACDIDRVYDYFGRALALYRKNGLNESEFWHHVCEEVHTLLTNYSS